MTKKQKKEEIGFAARCMLEQLDAMLASCEITQETYREKAAKIYAHA